MHRQARKSAADNSLGPLVMAGNASGQSPGRRRWQVSDAAIRGVIRAIYRDYRDGGSKAGSRPPNLNEIVKLVNERLAGYKASEGRIRTIAKEPEFAGLRWKRGQTTKQR